MSLEDGKTRVRPVDPLRWGHLHEEHLVLVPCGRTTLAPELHPVRIKRTGPVFPEHHYPWLELATIGLLKDSTNPGCPGLAVVWALFGSGVLMRKGETREGTPTLQIDYTHGAFRRTVSVEGTSPLSIYFLQKVLAERLRAHGLI